MWFIAACRRTRTASGANPAAEPLSPVARQTLQRAGTSLLGDDLWNQMKRGRCVTKTALPPPDVSDRGSCGRLRQKKTDINVSVALIIKRVLAGTAHFDVGAAGAYNASEVENN